jgi:hypothetical protein
MKLDDAIRSQIPWQTIEAAAKSAVARRKLEAIVHLKSAS